MSMKYFFYLISLFALINISFSLPREIRIGGLFGSDEEEQELVFRFAIDRINADKTILPKSTLIPQVEKIRKEDSFRADKKVCGLLQSGVVAIFGPLSGISSIHVQSICDALEIPHVETRWDFQSQRTDLSINLYPRPKVLARAYVDLVKAWGWKTFAIAYENNEGIIQLQDFFKEAHIKDWKIKLYQFEAGKPYRDTFWMIKRANEFNVILDVNKKNMYNVLKQAQQVGLMTEMHSYLITSLDLHTINLEDFKFGRTKISSFRLVDTTNPELQSLLGDWNLLATRIGKKKPGPSPEHLQTESALIYDAVKLLATALQDLDQSQSIDIQSLSCESGIPWLHGSSLINYMRPITFRGITGLVGFDQSGFRSSVTLDVMTISPDGLQKIGIWTESSVAENNLNISESWLSHYSPTSLQNKTLIITTAINEPYTMFRESASTKVGNERFEGYAVDLIEELSKILHFNYKFQLVKDGAYGRPGADGKWNGMIGELIRGEADIAVADLTITHRREEAVDFTYPFMSTGISILYKKPTTKVTTLFSFLSPFQNLVWVYVLGAYIGVSTILFIVGRLSPYEWDNPHPCRTDQHSLENNFSLLNSFWFTIGSLMQQGSDMAPKAMSTRTIAGIWYFFTLIMISSYTANLAAFLTVEKVVYPIENADELANQDKIKYGCLQSGSTASFFQDSKIPTYKKMWDFMLSNNDVFKKTNKEGREAVEQGEGNYAYLMESASIEYIVERKCNLTQIGGLLDNKGYGIATRKDSKYRMALSSAILRLQETGVLHTLKDRWWKQKKGGGACIDDTKKSGSVQKLSLGNVGGVFVVLLGGLAVSFMLAMCEFLWKTRNLSQKDSLCDEMLRDLKFALQCQGTTKQIQRKIDEKSELSKKMDPISRDYKN